MVNTPRVVKGLSGATNDIEFMPDNSGFVVSSGGNTLSLINPQTGELKVLATVPFELKAISISPDGKWLAGASWSGQVLLLNLLDQIYLSACQLKARIVFFL